MTIPKVRPEVLHADDDLDLSDLSGVPCAFRHRRCGGQTHLGAATVRRYLRDPFRLMGAGSSVWCAACQKNCRAADCEWIETGENVREYFRRLIGDAYLVSPRAWWGRFLLVYSVLGLVGVGGVALAYWKGFGDLAATKNIVLGGLALVAVYIVIAFAVRTYQYRSFAAQYKRAGG